MCTVRSCMVGETRLDDGGQVSAHALRRCELLVIMTAPLVSHTHRMSIVRIRTRREHSPILDGHDRPVPLNGLSSNRSQRRLEQAAFEEPARRPPAHCEVDARHGRDVSRRLAKAWAPASTTR